MRIILMYDLDFSTDESKKEYNKFHRKIISNGYLMIQYSVYMKIVNTQQKAEQSINKIKKTIPLNGNIRAFFITDKQYWNMKYLKGGRGINETINTEKRIIKINKDEI